MTTGGETPVKKIAGEDRVFYGNTRLYAYDFWMRYPDYLADELIERFDRTGDLELLAKAEQIFVNEEPDLRRIPMIRFRFGAYERIDDALAILTSRKLIGIGGRKTVDKIQETDFLVFPNAVTLCADIVAQAPILEWYPKRAALVDLIADGRPGSALKARQYERIQYASTPLGGVIPAIDEEVRSRLEDRLKRPIAETV